METIIRSMLLIGLIVVLAACTSGASSTPSATVAAPSLAPTEAPPSEPAPSGAPPSQAAAHATIALATNALGEIIVDAAGRTVYAFTSDTAGEPTCYDDCATAWPPLVVTDAAALSAGAGLDASKLTTVDRTDGTKQVKYGDRPLYYFASDAAAGDTNGQGLFSMWYAVDAAGELIGQEPS